MTQKRELLRYGKEHAVLSRTQSLLPSAYCLLLLLFVPVMHRSASGEIVESQICFRH